MKLKSRGQASIETIFMFGFLAVLATLLYVNSSQILKSNLESDKITNQIDGLNNAIKSIEAMPENSFKIIEFSLPNTTKSFLIQGKKLVLSLETDNNNQNDYVISAKNNFQGSLPQESGIYYLLIQLNDNKSISISNDILLNPSFASKTVKTNSSSRNYLHLINPLTSSKSISSCTATGAIANLIVLENFSQEISGQSINQIDYNIVVASAQAKGTYLGNIDCNASDASTTSVIEIKVI